MSIETGIVEKIESDPTLSQLLGTDDDMRLFPIVMDEGVGFPVMVYHVVDTERDFTLDGPSNLTRHRIQFTAYATQVDVMKTISRAIRKMFEGFRGVLPDGTTVQRTKLLDMRETFENDPNLYRGDVDLDFWFVEIL